MNNPETIQSDEVPTNIIQFPYIVKSKCPDCRGKGMVEIFAGRIKGESKCHKCNGTGKIRIN